MLRYSIFVLLFTIGLVKCFKTPTIKLLDGNLMPVVALGMFKINPDNVENSVLTALENGYRHIDTAFEYENEKEIGAALKKWFSRGNDRKDVYITTKIPPQGMRPDDISIFLDASLKNLGLDYIDMYLLHEPFGAYKTSDLQRLHLQNGQIAWDYSTDHLAIWKEMENQVRAGKIRSIGLSNFNKTQILRVWNNSEIKPTNLQVETNAYLQQNELLELCNELGIAFSAYSPLGSGATIHLRRKRDTSITLPPVIKHSVVQRIAKKYNKTPAQVLLRWGVQRNTVVLPKSTHTERILENIDIFDFQLIPEEMDQIKTLDQHGKYRKFDFLVYFEGVENHPEYPFADRIPK